MKESYTDRRSSPLGWRKPFLLGLLIGVLAPTIYLLAGGSEYFTAPRWATVVFWPGFFAGYNWHEHVMRDVMAAKVAGCIANGVAYALVFLAVVRLKEKFLRNSTRN